MKHQVMANILQFLCVINCFIQLSFAKRPNIWPLPQQAVIDETYFTIPSAESFGFLTRTHGKCQILDTAIKRYRDLTFLKDCSRLNSRCDLSNDEKNEIDFSIKEDLVQSRLMNDPNFQGQIMNITIQVNKQCESLPHLNMDEMYVLRINSPDFPNQAFLFANSVWGALRGLDTLSQLINIFPKSKTTFMINTTFILDYPRFSHRGLLLDTSRHFIPMRKIIENLELMEQTKLNVFHWHIVDDPSFPYVSLKFPQMSAQGAYGKENDRPLIYSQNDIAKVIEEGRLRGIRVLVEFDTPGHTQSWGNSIDNLLTKCYDGSKPNGDFGPVNPILETTYNFMKTFFTEISQVFKDDYIHLGGDEVDFTCWESNPDISNFMAKRNFSGNYNKLEEMYMQRIVDIIAGLKKSNIIWQEVFDNGVKLPLDSVINIWKDPPAWQEEMANVTQKGYRVVLSSPWYLNIISYGYDWKGYYLADPQAWKGTDEQKSLVIGGEVSMWGEWVDGTNLISRTWPRTLPIAERFWSASSVIDIEDATRRVVSQRCRLLKRGYRVQPIHEPHLTGDYCACDYAV